MENPNIIQSNNNLMYDPNSIQKFHVKNINPIMDQRIMPNYPFCQFNPMINSFLPNNPYQYQNM